MPMPRKVVDLSTGKIGKKKRVERKIQEEKIKLTRESLEKGPPAWLTDTAKEEFSRVVREAGAISLLDNLDLSTLAIYADQYSRYVEAATALQNDGMVSKKGTPSPYIGIMERTAKVIMSCSSKLGLATTDRLKLIVPKKEEKPQNKFMHFLGG